MKGKRITRMVLPLLMCASALCSAQTTEINYSAWIGPSGCNIFGTPTPVTFVTHKSTLGQPKYGSYLDPVILECVAEPFNVYKGTEYAIALNFQANHQYKVTVDCASNSNGLSPRLVLTYANTIGSSVACSGPANDNDFNAQGFVISGTGYSNFDYINTIGAQAQSYLKFRAIATSGGPALQQIIIRKIIVRDITPAPPAYTFTLASSESVKPCASQGLDPITFTVSNVDNAPGVSGYTFYVESGKWLMNGVPAGPAIATTSNSITLTPVNCSPKANVYCKVGVGNFTYTTNTKIIAVRNPIYAISDPTVSSSSFATYDLVIAPNLPLYLPCPSPISWTVSDFQIATISTNAGATSATVTRNGRGPGQGIVTLTATMNLCGETVTASRSVQVTPFGVMSGTVKLDGLLPGNEGISGKLITGVSPNPTTGLFVVDLGREVSDADMLVMDINGKPVQKRKVSGAKIQVDLSAAASGMYFVKIGDSADGGMAKIVKR